MLNSQGLSNNPELNSSKISQTDIYFINIHSKLSSHPCLGLLELMYLLKFSKHFFLSPPILTRCSPHLNLLYFDNIRQMYRVPHCVAFSIPHSHPIWVEICTVNLVPKYLQPVFPPYVKCFLLKYFQLKVL